MPNTYEIITERIVTKLEAGTVPWRQPWSKQHAEPTSLATGKTYRGINWLLLAASGYYSPYWLTFKEARSRGGHIRAGEKATTVVYWNVHEEEDKETGEHRRSFLLRHYWLFNLSQTEGVPAPASISPRSWNPIEAADNLWLDWQDRPKLRYRGGDAYYSPANDEITLPVPEAFDRPEHYYATIMHEAVHATGHSSRLNRGLDHYLAPFGSPDYSREELIAEMGGAFLCAHLGIDSVTLDNQASYIAAWIDRLRGDSRLAVNAASQAQRAADCIRGIQPTTLLTS